MWPSTFHTLLDRVAAGHQDAWHEFAGRYRAPVLRWMRVQQVQPADAEDVFQEVLLKLHKKLNQYNPALGLFRHWLRRVLKNMLNDFREARKRVPGATGTEGLEILETLASNESLDQLVSELDPVEFVKNSALWRLVEELIPANDLVCYLAFECHGRTVEEIAAELGRTPHAIHQAVYRTRKKIEELRIRFAQGTEGEQPNMPER